MFSSFQFVVIVATLYVVLQLIPRNWFGTAFGALNFIAIGLLFSWQAVLTLMALTFFLWSALSLATRFQIIRSKVKILRLGCFFGGILAILTLCFLSDLEAVFKAYWGGQTSTTINFFLVIGLSYISLRMWDCYFAVFEGSRLINPLALGGYLMPFFMVMAGPIGGYRDHLHALNQPHQTPTFKHFVDCLFLISLGYAMKFFFAELYQTGMAGTARSWVFETAWDTWLYLVYILLEFWGYSLIALGVGRLLGIATPVNFNHPYLATTTGEFWTRWHISLGTFVARNMYNPILLFFVRRISRTNMHLLFVSNLLALWLPFIFTGLWHHASLAFLWWGLLVGLIVALEKALYNLKTVKSFLRAQPLGKATPVLWRIVGMMYTQVTVALTLSIAVKEFQLP